MTEVLGATSTLLVQGGAGRDPETMRLEPEHAYVEDGHAVIPYNSRAFLDEGRKRERLLGNLPVLVDLSLLECADT
ncbi:hypothetical protein ACIQCJ_24725 [Streptomyces sp. NPDC093221]|uniref:hypothetical protein n=1 Tax=Streptomyces sp. NPDC093221 TaxID=3366032 RepID=UPI00382AFF9D